MQLARKDHKKAEQLMKAVRVLLPRDETGLEEVQKMVKEHNGTSDWDNSGKGARYGVLTCVFANESAAGEFLAFLFRLGFQIDVRLPSHGL